MTEQEQEESNFGDVHLNTHPSLSPHGPLCPHTGNYGHGSSREEAPPFSRASVTIYNILYFICFSCFLSLSLLEQKPHRAEILRSTWRTTAWHAAGTQVANIERRNQHCFLWWHNYVLGPKSYSLSIRQINPTRLPLSHLRALHAGLYTIPGHSQAPWPPGTQTQTPLEMQGALSIIMQFNRNAACSLYISHIFFNKLFFFSKEREQGER